VQQKFDEARAGERRLVLVLVLPKAPSGSNVLQGPLPKWALPKWMVLRVSDE